MRILDAASVAVDYGQIYVMDGATMWADPVGSIGGQLNGLCGATWPGALMMITGRHDGPVLFTVDVDDTAPPVDDSWEDIVEVSYVPATDDVVLMEMMGFASYPIPLAPGVSYRARYHASGMDAADDGYPDPEELAGDRYLLTFWPASPAPDAIIKQTSRHARYWHDAAAEMAIPPTPQQIAEEERLAKEQADREMEESSAVWGWGDRPPTERQREARGSNILAMVGFDRDLTDSVSAADPSVQRAVAHWAAHRALEAAGLAQLDWVAPALLALDAGAPLPTPFEPFRHDLQPTTTLEEARAAYDPALDPFAWLNRDPAVVWTTVAHFGGGPLQASRQHMALPALQGAAADHPLVAAMNALSAAAVSFGDERPALFDNIRAAFPELR